MNHSIFKFWSQLRRGQKIHPADIDILKSTGAPHHFDLTCWPAPYVGPLKTADVVLLFLNPGVTEHDYRRSERDRCFEQLSGKHALPTHDEHETANRWIKKITTRFGDFESIKERIAILELCAYHSEKFKDWHMLSVLPSSRVVQDWVLNVLFPDAIKGKRVVICLRSSRYWGLGCGQRYGKALFVPETNRGSFILRECKVGRSAIEAVQRVISD